MPTNLSDDQFIYITKGDFHKAQNIHFYMGLIGGFAIGVTAILISKNFFFSGMCFSW